MGFTDNWADNWPRRLCEGGEGVRGDAGNDENEEVEVSGGVWGTPSSTSTSGAAGIKALDVADGGGGSPVVGKSSTLRFLVFFELCPLAGASGTLEVTHGTRGNAAVQFLQPQAVELPRENIPLPALPETGLGNEGVVLADLMYRKARRPK